MTLLAKNFSQADTRELNSSTNQTNSPSKSAVVLPNNQNNQNSTSNNQNLNTSRQKEDESRSNTHNTNDKYKSGCSCSGIIILPEDKPVTYLVLSYA